LVSRFLSAIETIGNALPHPATLFAIFALGLIGLSWLFSKLGLDAVNPKDGSTVEAINLISPMMSFFALIVAFVQRYDEKAGIGTVIATMLPYSIAFLAVWMVLLSIWLLIGAPLGPGAGLYLAQ
jgi:p-aminobenzoyl-glutamate transporter AbgT